MHLTIALDMSLLLAIRVLAIGSRSIPLFLEVSGYHTRTQLLVSMQYAEPLEFRMLQAAGVLTGSLPLLRPFAIRVPHDSYLDPPSPLLRYYTVHYSTYDHFSGTRPRFEMEMRDQGHSE